MRDLHDTDLQNIIEKLSLEHNLTREELLRLLGEASFETDACLFEMSRRAAQENFGSRVYVRGLIEFTNYCANDCYYCGIRRGNKNAARYRLTPDEILGCCETGYELGFKTFVLQGGEDAGFSDADIISLISAIKQRFSGCAVTLSIGERKAEVYRSFAEAGADRYLLRHETADPEHYAKLHPRGLTLESRIRCLEHLKAAGFQTGAGFMVGSPFQTLEHIVGDLLFLKAFAPQMVGIGPFLPHHDTPFACYPAGDVDLTLRCLAVARLLLPMALIPSTTALGTADSSGRQKGVLAGANVVMPNLSPHDMRERYSLYDNKLATDAEAAEGLDKLRAQMAAIGYEVVMERGDHEDYRRGKALCTI